MVDAGAGTGKTQLIVNRILELVAPEAESETPIPLSKLAAITFTRRAAGELRFRIRASFLNELGDPKTAPRRRSLLQRAVDELDTAMIGTIHSFADRLLRTRPMEAKLSPEYEICEDANLLVQETFRLLIHACETKSLASELDVAADEITETQATISDYRRAGLRTMGRPRSGSSAGEILGLNDFVEAVINNRDVLPEFGSVPAPPDLSLVRPPIRTFVDAVKKLSGESWGHRWLRGRALELEPALTSADPIETLGAIQSSLTHMPSVYIGKGDHFGGDDAGWKLWNQFKEGDKKAEIPALKDSMGRPLYQWMGARLARTTRIIVRLYEAIKARREVVDQLDLLLKLRDALKDPKLHAVYRDLFAHIFVDEFQDTDPIQAEILFYLCAKTPPQDWTQIAAEPGRLTIVGDPKQSIYRFRRADIATYQEVCERLDGALHESLVGNFRSTPALIEFFNRQLPGLLGKDPTRTFDPESGRAFYQDLATTFQGGGKTAAHVLKFECEKLNKKSVIPIEARAIARHLKWLKEQSGFQVRDLRNGHERPLEYGDIVVLTRSTYNLDVLFRELDRYGVPYSAQGGRLFLEEPVVRSFILGLRAIADRDDGVAQAALFRPPFFAVDLSELVSSNAEDAKRLIEELRKDRFSRPPVHTATALLDHSGFAKTVSLSPNGEQRLQAVRELLRKLDVMAQEEGLDFDAVTERLREWVQNPEQVDPPAPLGGRAVGVMTIHQSKGLEFPIVVLWDALEALNERDRDVPWAIDRDGKNWSIDLHHFHADSGLNLGERELTYRDAERLRLYYVAATRARDLLIFSDPMSPGKATNPTQHVYAAILNGSDPVAIQIQQPFTLSSVQEAVSFPEPITDEKFEAELKSYEQNWAEARAHAERPLSVPMGIATAAHLAADVADEFEDEANQGKVVGSRFGPVFGTVVHRVLSRAVMNPNLELRKEIERVAMSEKYSEKLDEALKDVERTLNTLKNNGLFEPTVNRCTEYALSLLSSDGRLLIGYADFVALGKDVVWLIDFKTDAPGSAETAYRKQLRLYAGALAAAGLTRPEQIKAGLLYTATGSIAWMNLDIVSGQAQS